MATPDVTKLVELPAGAPHKVRGRLRLYAATEGEAFGYTASADIGGISEVVADDTGLLTWPDVTPNTLVTEPANTVYEVVVTIDGRPQAPEYIAVPDEAGPVAVHDIITLEPADLPPPSVGFAGLGGVLDGTVADAEFATLGGLPSVVAPTGTWDREMRTARAAWQRRADDPMNVWIIGDSITEGYTSTDILNAWAQKTAAALYRAAGQTVPVGYRSLSTLVDYASGYTRSGTVANVATSGIGYGGQAISKDAYVEFTATADGVAVLFPHQQFNGQGRLSVDGVTVTPNIIPINNGSTTLGGRIFWSGDLDLEEHTFRLTGVDALNFPFTAEGWFFTSGNGPVAQAAGLLDQAAWGTGAGLRVWLGGHFGYNASHFAAAQGARTWADGATLAPCHLLVIALGTNDYGAGRTPAQYAADLVTTVGRVTTANAAAGAPAPSVVLVTPFGTGAVSATDSDAHRAAGWAQAIASGWAVIDWNAILGYTGAAAGGDPLELTADNLHPNDAGHALLGAAVSDQLLRALAVNPTIYV